MSKTSAAGGGISGTFLRFIREKKNIYLVLIMAASLLLAVFSLSLGQEKESGAMGGETLEEYRARLEAELATLCESVDGAGKCKVSINFSEGERYEYRGTQLIATKPPTVSGISVLCRGGDSDIVKKRISEMLSALYGIGENRISVLKLSG